VERSGQLRKNADVTSSAESPVEPLYAATWALVPTGATLDQIAQEPALLKLGDLLGAEALDDRAAVTARDELIAACRSLDDRSLVVEPQWHGEGAAVLALLGLATGFHSAPLHRRREGAASLLGYEVATAFKTRPGVRSHAQNAVNAVADRLWERMIRARAQQAASTAMERPDLSALSVEVLRRYEAYYSMYTPLTALRADVLAVLDLRSAGDTELNRLDDFVASSLHAYSEFLLAKSEFMDNYHGVWVFGQADIEQAVADAIKLIEHFSGLRYREESVLRLQAAQGELHTFTTDLETSTEGRVALRRWRDRILSCECDLDGPRDACSVHKLARAAEYFTAVLDLDWYRMVPWHGAAPPNLDTVDPATLYRDIGIRPPGP
jgi:hypothetical protein